jgi:hypothetical protein
MARERSRIPQNSGGFAQDATFGMAPNSREIGERGRLPA